MYTRNVTHIHHHVHHNKHAPLNLLSRLLPLYVSLGEFCSQLVNLLFQQTTCSNPEKEDIQSDPAAYVYYTPSCIVPSSSITAYSPGLNSPYPSVF